MKKRERVLVTGAGGFIGSHIVEALLDKGYSVLALDVADDRKIAHLRNNKYLTIIKTDITTFDEISSVFGKKKDIDCVFHVAALYLPKSIDVPFPYYKANVEGTLNVLEAARRHGVKKVIYSSSMAVYGDVSDLPVDELAPLNPNHFYGQSKLMGEELCNLYANHYGFKIIVLRYSGVYGPRREVGALYNFVANAKKNQPIIIDKNISWDQVYVKDVAKANVLALQKIDALDFQIINIGSGREIPIKDLAQMIIDISKSTSKVELQEGFTDTPEMRFYFDITKAKNLLGFTPTPQDKALQEYIQTL